MVSATLKSVPAIYVLVPFLLIPQILFSGVVVKFDQLNYKVGDQDKVPLIGEVMASRWAFEALTVRQFNDNQYQKNFTEINTKESISRVKLFFIIPLVNSAIDSYNSTDEPKTKLKELKLINNGLLMLGIYEPSKKTDKDFIKLLSSDIEQVRNKLSGTLNKIRLQKDQITQDLTNSCNGVEGLTALRHATVNKAISELVQNRTASDQVIQVESEIFIKTDPIYRVPQSKFGRAHFFAPCKRIGFLLIETYWFNLIIIWLMIFLLYIFLVFEIFPKSIKGLQKLYQHNLKSLFKFL
jgi:hypothetical protein